MKKQIVAGLDIGTSSLKMTLADAHKEEVIENLQFPYRDFTELAPGVVPLQVYLDNITVALGSIAQRYAVACIAVSTQMYSICEQRDACTLVHQWNSLWERVPEREPLIEPHLLRSGCQCDSIFGAYKAATAAAGTRFLPYGLKEAVIKYLTGELATDYATASASGLFDVRERRWNLDFIRMIGLDESQLPRPTLAHSVVGTLRSGLIPGLSGTAVVPGLGDGPSASYACRDISSFCGNLGTSMAARVFTMQPDISRESGLWNYAVDDEYYLAGGISSNSCSVFTWAGQLGWKTDCELVPTGGVIFLPWLYGERMPYWSSELRGGFLGLRAGDGPAVMAAAINKAVGFTFARTAKMLQPYAGGDEPLVLGGGGIKQLALLETVAGCLDCEIALLENSDYLCSAGAVKSAALGAGIELALNSEINRTLRPTGRFLDEYSVWLEWAEKLSQLTLESNTVKTGSVD